MRRKDIQKSLIAKAISNIHVISDTWTSPANIGVFGVILTWIGDDSERHTILANLHQLEGSHDVAQYSSLTLKTIEEWCIGANLGYMNMDNAIVIDRTATMVSLGT